jgi:GT2 family glycosyltransferase
MENKVKIDIIILSYAKTADLKKTTEEGIASLLKSEDSEKIEFEILVIESNNSLKPYQYPNTKTIYPEIDFGYNKYLNIGIKATNNNYVCLSNNDLIYHKNWASEILKAMDNDPALLSASPYCSTFHKNQSFDENGPPLEGYFGVLGGWCIFAKREVFDIIGPLDEKLAFWYCDADYCNTLVKYGVKNCLIPASLVTHLGSESLKTLDHTENKKLTQIPRFYYSYKWHHHSYLKYKLQTLLFKLKMAVGL